MSSIPLPALGVRPPEQQEDPITKFVRLKSMLQGQQLQGQQLQENALQIKQKQQAMQDQQIVQQALQQTNGDLEQAAKMTYGKVSPQTTFALQKAHRDAQKEVNDLDAAERAKRLDQGDRLSALIQQAKALPPDQYAASYPQIAAAAKAIRPELNIPDQPIPQQALDGLQMGLVVSKNYLEQQKAERERTTFEAELPGKQAESKMKAEEASMSPMERSIRGQDALAYYAAKGDATAEAALQKKAALAKASRPNVNVFTEQDAKDVADAIESGDQPPTIQGLYRNAAPVRAELARRGVPLAKMEMDWKATQRFLSTLNGPQQLRMQQSINSAEGMIDKIEGLYNEWKQVATSTGYKAINRGTLAVMKNLPGRPGAVAQALDTQIADLTADLGNVYMGGNTPTDQALKLAAKNLSAEWNDDTFQEGLKQARANVRIRANSMKHSLPAGVSPNTMYPMPNQQEPAKKKRFNIETGKIEEY